MMIGLNNPENAAMVGIRLTCWGLRLLQGMVSFAVGACWWLPKCMGKSVK